MDMRTSLPLPTTTKTSFPLAHFPHLTPTCLKYQLYSDFFLKGESFYLPIYLPTYLPTYLSIAIYEITRKFKVNHDFEETEIYRILAQNWGTRLPVP